MKKLEILKLIFYSVFSRPYFYVYYNFQKYYFNLVRI